MLRTNDSSVPMAALICHAVDRNDIADIRLNRHNRGGVAAGILTVAQTGEKF